MKAIIIISSLFMLASCVELGNKINLKEIELAQNACSRFLGLKDLWVSDPYGKGSHKKVCIRTALCRNAIWARTSDCGKTWFYTCKEEACLKEYRR